MPILHDGSIISLRRHSSPTLSTPEVLFTIFSPQAALAHSTMQSQQVQRGDYDNIHASSRHFKMSHVQAHGQSKCNWAIFKSQAL